MINRAEERRRTAENFGRFVSESDKKQRIFKMRNVYYYRNKSIHPTRFKVDDTRYPQWSFTPKRLIFAALCNDLIDYFIVCFEHQCNTMGAF